MIYVNSAALGNKDPSSCCSFLLTFVIVPHSDFGQFAETEQVRKSEHVFHFTLKLIPVGALLQRQRPGVSKFSKHHQKHIGISAGI